jgi:hypothetical protein
MKPVNLAAQLAAAETELACPKMALAQVKERRLVPGGREALCLCQEARRG